MPSPARRTGGPNLVPSAPLLVAAGMGAAASLLHPVLGVATAAAAGTAFAGPVTGAAAAAVTALAATVIAVGLGTLLNPAYLLAAGAGVALGWWLRNAADDDSDPDEG